MVDNEPVLFEILDISTKPQEGGESTAAGAAGDESILKQIEAIRPMVDGIMLVYSITDRDSFNFIRKAKSEITDADTVILVGNKGDMVHLRQISHEEGEILAKDFDCQFIEVSAAEHVERTADCFHELCQEILSNKRKSKQSLLDRMLGARVYSRGKSDSALPKD